MGRPWSVDKLFYEMRRLAFSRVRTNTASSGISWDKGRKVAGGNLSSLQMKVIKFINGISQPVCDSRSCTRWYTISPLVMFFVLVISSPLTYWTWAHSWLLMCKTGILLPFNSPLRRVTSVFSVTKASISVFPNCSLCGENPAGTVSPIFNVQPHCLRSPVFNFAELPYSWWLLILHHISPRQPSRAQHFPAYKPCTEGPSLAKRSKGCRRGPWAWCCLGWS